MAYETDKFMKKYIIRIKWIILIPSTFLKSLKKYESDMGGWKSRFMWELGNLEGSLAMKPRSSEPYSAYECGHYNGWCDKSRDRGQ